MGPEMEAQEDGIRTRRSRRSRSFTQASISTEAEIDDVVDESILGHDSNQDEYEFIPFVFLASIWQRLCALFSKSPYPDEEQNVAVDTEVSENINTVKGGFLTQMSKILSSSWRRFSSLFYWQQAVRRSRRLQGLGPEVGPEATRRRTRRSPPSYSCLPRIPRRRIYARGC